MKTHARSRFIAMSVMCTVIAAWTTAGAALAATKVPYTDPAASGYIGLCDKSGNALTKGSVTDKPFVWNAVDSIAAPSSYEVAGATATLYAYQPRKDVPPGEWSGEQLTAAGRYSNPAHPMTAATDGDSSLQDFLSDYPAQWDGLVQLRIYLGAPGRSVDSLNYAATDLQVKGKTWRVLDGGAALCSSGQSVSVETLLLPPSDLSPSPSPSVLAVGSSTSPSVSGTAPQATDLSAARHSNRDLLIWVGAVVLVLAGAGSYVTRRRATRSK